MKIGILTFHRAHNYGAVLQCYALQETLKFMGHDVKVINYIQPAIEYMYRDRHSFSIKTFVNRLPFAAFTYAFYKIINDISIVLHGSQRKQVFEQFVKNRLYVTTPCDYDSIPQDFDTYIIGSDMLWDNVCTGGKFDNVFLGNFPHRNNSKILGYAISGTTESFELLGVKGHYLHLSNFKNISFREKSFTNIVKKYTGLDYPVCLDPTLLADSNIWKPMFNSKWREKNYIVSYYIRVNNADKITINNKMQKYANTLGCEIINLDATVNALPVEEFISIIRYARYVVTDSFHGIIFSLLFHRCFNALVFHDSGDSRYINLLSSLGLEKACVEITFSPNQWSIDYESVDEKLNRMRIPSQMYLRNNLC